MTREEYNRCVDQHSDNIYRFILKNLRDPERSKDVVQDTYEKMWLKVEDVSFEKSKSYLFTTAYHTMIDLIRKDKRITSLEQLKQEDHSHTQQYSDLSEILKAAVDRLPDIQRSVIMLRDYEGYSYKEIGEITGLSEDQVKVYIFRGRMALKQFIGTVESVL